MPEWVNLVSLGQEVRCQVADVGVFGEEMSSIITVLVIVVFGFASGRYHWSHFNLGHFVRHGVL